MHLLSVPIPKRGSLNRDEYQNNIQNTSTGAISVQFDVYCVNNSCNSHVEYSIYMFDPPPVLICSMFVPLCLVGDCGHTCRSISVLVIDYLVTMGRCGKKTKNPDLPSPPWRQEGQSHWGQHLNT